VRPHDDGDDDIGVIDEENPSVPSALEVFFILSPFFLSLLRS
jgi:hypothetical protein